MNDKFEIQTNVKVTIDISEDINHITTDIFYLKEEATQLRQGGDILEAILTDRDALDLEAIVCHLDAGEIDRARLLIHELDTASRERVPTRLYNLLIHGRDEYE